MPQARRVLGDDGDRTFYRRSAEPGGRAHRDHPRGLRHHDQPLHFIETADPDEGPGGPGPGSF